MVELFNLVSSRGLTRVLILQEMISANQLKVPHEQGSATLASLAYRRFLIKEIFKGFAVTKPVLFSLIDINTSQPLGASNAP